ncbi:Flp family type IVb pilin [Sphingomonas lutea]|uniref:Flp family type IVb pilin n=1 Tax=Sphingomonas lutea TaxID=1045317 RepID=A0A7G9SGH9_9SPHN|nr:Flp family type IVb pilin [Sphingomonas lutea]QNN66954.1 Flp family type IVb pilin [Sphingomonas lutea]
MDKSGSGHAALLSRGRRHAVELEAAIVRDGVEQWNRVTDLSLDGCCLSGDFLIGEQVTVRIPPLGTFRAQVRWALSGRAGARFIRTGQTAAPTSLSKDKRGVAAIEYALIASLIAIALVAAVGGTGEAVGDRWNGVDKAMPGGVHYQS